MQEKIKQFLQGLIVSVGEKFAADLINKYLTKENINAALDAGIDILEDLAAKTETKLDDQALKALRDALNIPDGDK